MVESLELPKEKINARIAAGSALTLAAGRVSASFSKFATWFLAAFGAGLTFVFAHLAELSAYLPLSVLVNGLHLFLWACIICVAQRYVAMVIEPAVEAYKDGVELGGKLAPMDLEEFFSQMKNSVPFFLRPILESFFGAVMKKDFAASGRMLLRLTIIQGLLVSAEIIVLLFALNKILNSVRG